MTQERGGRLKSFALRGEGRRHPVRLESHALAGARAWWCACSPRTSVRRLAKEVDQSKAFAGFLVGSGSEHVQLLPIVG